MSSVGGGRDRTEHARADFQAHILDAVAGAKRLPHIQTVSRRCWESVPGEAAGRKGNAETLIPGQQSIAINYVITVSSTLTCSIGWYDVRLPWMKAKGKNRKRLGKAMVCQELVRQRRDWVRTTRLTTNMWHAWQMLQHMQT